MAITIDGNAITPWWLVKSTGLDDLPTVEVPIVALPGRETSVVSSLSRALAPREGVLTVATQAESYAAMVTASTTLGRLTAKRTPAVLTHLRRPNQRLMVHFLGSVGGYGLGPEAVVPIYLEWGLRYRAVDPCWEDATEQTATFTTTPDSVTLGTADHRGVLRITASGSTVTDPVITYKNGAGTTLWTLTPDVEILNGDAWEWDGTTGQARVRVSGTWSNAQSTLPLSYTSPVFRVEHIVASTMPTLAVSSGTGTLVYRRRYR